MFSKRDLLKIILPAIIQQVLSITLTTVNSIMVASSGEAAVSGVSLVGTLDTLLIVMFSSLITGGTVIISHALGDKNTKYAQECAKQLIYISTGIALLITILISSFCTPLLTLLYKDAEPDVLMYADNYLKVLVLSFPFLALFDACASIFRVMGNTVVSMILSFIMNIINIAASALFIYIYHMGTAGAALAALISRVICSIIMMSLLHNPKHSVHFKKLLHYRPDFKTIKQILRIGVPHGIENSMFQFGRLLVQILVSSLGTASIAANSVANTLANYLYMPSNSIQNCAVTVVGRCIGAKEKEQAKKYSKTLLFWTYLSMWAVSLLLFITAKPIIAIYGLPAKSSLIALQLTIFHAICTSLIRPLAFIFPSIFKAAGDIWYSFIVTTLSMWTIRIGLAYILSLESITIFSYTLRGAGLGIFGVWIAMIADWSLRAILFTLRFNKGKWLLQKTLV